MPQRCLTHFRRLLEHPTAGLRVVPGRRDAEGKKIKARDGFIALYWLIKVWLQETLARRRPKAQVVEGPRSAGLCETGKVWTVPFVWRWNSLFFRPEDEGGGRPAAGAVAVAGRCWL